MASNKPVIHGRDHLPGGADPIPNLDDIITGALGGAFAPAHCKYLTDTVNVASGFGEYVEWSAVALSGDTTLLDLTAPDGPKVTTAGVYCVMATFKGPEDTSWTTGSQYFAVLTAIGTEQCQLSSSVTVGESNLPTGGDQFLGFGHISLTWDMPVDGTFSLLLNNYDSVSHDMSAVIFVTRILTTA